MMGMEDFSNYLFEKEGYNVFQDIKKKMIQTIIHSMKSVQESIGQRKNTFEFFGYDFMIDTKFNPWLIEINTSPSMECTTVKIFMFITYFFIQKKLFLACYEEVGENGIKRYWEIN